VIVYEFKNLLILVVRWLFKMLKDQWVEQVRVVWLDERVRFNGKEGREVYRWSVSAKFWVELKSCDEGVYVIFKNVFRVLKDGKAVLDQMVFILSYVLAERSYILERW
jgi:hypothetical protein